MLVFTASSVALGAVNVKKASSVKKQKTEAVESATSLLPTVIGVVSSIKNLNAQQQQLEADCAPTSSELRFVNELVQEWAKTGETTAKGMISYDIGKQECTGGYATFMQNADKDQSCYEIFNSGTDKGTIWEGYPKASAVQICESAGKNCKTVSNIYAVFSKIGFDDKDLLKSEISDYNRIKEKFARCAPEKVNAAKRELYGGFLTQTLSGVGQTTGAAGTSDVLNAVTSLGGSGDFKSLIPSLGQMAAQTLDK